MSKTTTTSTASADFPRVVTSELKVPMGLAALMVDPTKGAAVPGLETGIHLNWALPDALLRGEVNDGDQGQEVSFPEIPDTWLILRLSPPSAGTKRAMRAWVLDSWSGTHQSLSDWQQNPANNRDPALKLTGLGFMNAEGEIVERAPLRSVSIGEDQAAFTAYYPYARDRFGFYDDLSDVSAGPVSYMVVGWYGDSARDPLTSATSDMARLDILEAFKWEVEGWSFQVPYDYNNPPASGARSSQKSAAPGGIQGLQKASPGGTSIYVVEEPGGYPVTPNPGEEPEPGPTPVKDPGYIASTLPPSLLVCHGEVVDIPWGSGGGTLQPQDYNPTPKPGKASFSVGDSPADALGSLLAESNNADRRWLLDLLQGRGLRSLQSLDGIASIQAELHQQGFFSQAGLGVEDALKVMEADPQWGGLVAQLKADPAYTGVVAGGGSTGGTGGGTTGGGVVVDPTQTDDVSQELEAHEVRRMAKTGALTPSDALSIKGANSLSAASLTAQNTKDAEEAPSAVDGPTVDSGSLSSTIEPPPAPPRYWRANPPVLMVSGAGRSFLYGHDGRFDDDDLLNCRVVSQTVKAVHLSVIQSDIEPAGDSGAKSGGMQKTSMIMTYEVDITASDIALMPNLSRLPLSVRELAEEMPLLDPTSADAAVGAFSAETYSDPQYNNLDPVKDAWLIETTCWWLTALGGVDKDEVQELCNVEGVLPSTIALTPYTNQWHTLYLDYDALVLPATGPDSGWTLGEVDRDPSSSLSFASSPVTVSGRAVVTDSAPMVLADAIERMLMDDTFRDALDAADPNALALLEDEAEELRTLDILSGDMKSVDQALVAAGLSVRSGLLAFQGLKLVDCFGREVSVDPSKLKAEPEEWLHIDNNQLQSAWSGSLYTNPAAGDYHGLALPPRLLTGARYSLRFMDGSGVDVEAGAGVSPIAGYVILDHVDIALEVFHPSGRSEGQLRLNDAGVAIWEPAPGREARQSEGAGGSIENPYLRGLVQGVLNQGFAMNMQAAGTPNPLQALVALLDTVRNSVDRIGDSEEFLSTLMGAPIAVVRARGVLEYEPKAEEVLYGRMVDVYGESSALGMLSSEGLSAPDPLQSLPFSNPMAARLGSLSQMDDGLLGFFQDSHFEALATPLNGDITLSQATWQPDDWALRDIPFIQEGSALSVAPTQATELTFLMTPGAGVHLTSGFLPRKRISLTREWLKEGLGRLAPTFAFGPLLVDPNLFRMPLPGSERFDWEWTRRARPAAGEGGWSLSEPGQATDRATLSKGRVEVQEGWLRMAIKE